MNPCPISRDVLFNAVQATISWVICVGSTYPSILACQHSIQSTPVVAEKEIVSERLEARSIRELLDAEHRHIVEADDTHIRLLMKSSDIGVSCRAAWEHVRRQVKRTAVDAATTPAMSEKDMAWLAGFIEAKTGVQAPKNWLKCLESGQPPRAPQDGFTFNDIPYDRPISVRVGPYELSIMGQTGVAQGRVSLMGGDSKNDVIWNVVLWSTLPIDDDEDVIGFGNNTLWLGVALGSDSATIDVWGCNEIWSDGDVVCYFLRIDARKGERVDFFYLFND